MKAAIRSRYGPPEVLRIEEVAIPTLKENEVLIRVRAATVNRSDCHVLTGLPLFMRLLTGLFKPRLATTGSDFAGTVEATGSNVKTFKVGDRVMGFEGGLGAGSHAQYLAFPETGGIVNIPESLSYEEAAACMEGAWYAFSTIDYLKPKAGQKALVYGATGAIGCAFVQFLKFYDVSITAVCPTENDVLIKSLGAERIIDYRTEGFTQDKERYDYVFDAVGKASFYKCKSVLRDNGLYTATGGFINIIPILTTALFRGKKALFIMPPRDIKAGLNFIKELIEKGKFRGVVDRTYPLEKIADAFTFVASGQKIGNVIIKMDS